MANQVQKHVFDIVVAYIEHVSKFHSYVNSLKNLSAQAELRRHISELQNQTKGVQQLAASGGLATAPIKSFTKFLVKLNKNLDALDRGIEIGTIASAKSFRDSYKEVTLPIVRDIIAHSKTLEPNMSEDDLVGEIKFAKQKNASKATVNMMEQTLKNIRGEKISEADVVSKENKVAHQQLEAYRKFASRLPTTLKGKQFLMLELPVVPAIDFTALDPKFLRTTGLDYTHIADSFIVFNNQYLLAFDYAIATTPVGESVGKKVVRKSADSVTFKNSKVAVLDEDGDVLLDDDGKPITETKRVANTNTLAARKRTAEHLKLQEDFVLKVLDRINSKAGTDYTLMSSHFEFCPANGRIALAWIVPRAVKNQFARKGNMADASWGWPWDSNTTSAL